MNPWVGTALMSLNAVQQGFWPGQTPIFSYPSTWCTCQILLRLFRKGLAAGRAVSIAIDGMPHPLLTIYLGLEPGFGVVGLYLAIRLQDK
jgi:hypothetical protein